MAQDRDAPGLDAIDLPGVDEPRATARRITVRITNDRWLIWGVVYREIVWTDESEEHIELHDITPSEVEELVNSRPVYSTSRTFQTKGR